MFRLTHLFGCSRSPRSTILLFTSLCLIANFNSCGDDTTVPEDEKTFKRVGRAVNPDWLPDNSGVSGVGGSYVRICDPEPSREPNPGDPYMHQTECDDYQLGDNNVFYHAWANDPDNLKLIFAEIIPNSGHRLMWMDGLDGTPYEIYVSSGRIECPSWTYDNKQIAFLAPDEFDGIMLINSDGVGEPQPLSNDNGWGNLTFARCCINSPDILFTSNYSGANNVYKISLEGGEPLRLTDFNDATPIACTELSPDGSTLAFVAPSTRDPRWGYSVVYLKVLPDGESNPIVTNLINPAKELFHTWKALAWSPDGTHIVAGCKDNYYNEVTDLYRDYSFLYVIDVDATIN